MAVWSACAVALYLLPVALFFLIRASSKREREQAALDAPMIVALDLLSLVLLARLVPLELATLVSRTCWLLGGSFVLYQRRRPLGEWWRTTRKLDWVGPSAAGALGAFLSTWISTACGLWDRYWHIPLVGSMRGQFAPFFNIYEQQPRPLFYHYAGDVIAAMLQALSFDHLHSSAALSRAHDVMVALFAAVMAALAPAFGARRLTLVLTLPLAMLLAGPVTVLAISPEPLLGGRATTFLFSTSFRPHVSLAFLLIAGFCAAVLLPLIEARRFQPSHTRGCLLSCTALLVLTDETSLALLGALFAVVLLMTPRALAATPRRAVAIGALLLVLIGAMVLLFGGTFQPGAPRQKMLLVAARVPGFMQHSVLLWDANSVWVFVREFWGVLLVTIAGLVAVLQIRRLVPLTMALAYIVLAVVGLGCLSFIEINGNGTESHRFATAPMLLAPLFGVYFATRPELSRFYQHGALITIPVTLAVAFPSISSLEWIFARTPKVCETQSMPTYAATDCRKDMGARYGQRPMMAYVDSPVWHEFAGCRPLNAPSPNTGGGNGISMGWPQHGWSAVDKLRGWQGGGDVVAFCSTAPDDVCSYALSDPAACVEETPKIRRCRIRGRP